MLECEITDSGKPVEQKEKYQWFEPYYTTKEKTKSGSGLGLYLSKKIIENHGGKIELDFESVVTRFVILLPISQS